MQQEAQKSDQIRIRSRAYCNPFQGFEGMRLADEFYFRRTSAVRLTTPRQVASYLRRVMRMDIEEFWILAFTSARDLLAADCLFRGTVDACFFHPRDVFRFACRWNAASIVVAHNHPSGNLYPSSEDQEITCRLVKASRILNLPVTDHIIVTSRGHFSFFERGLMAEDLVANHCRDNF